MDGTQKGFERARYLVNAQGLNKTGIAQRTLDYLKAMKGICF
jgi:hypothetical protein